MAAAGHGGSMTMAFVLLIYSLLLLITTVNLWQTQKHLRQAWAREKEWQLRSEVREQLWKKSYEELSAIVDIQASNSDYWEAIARAHRKDPVLDKDWQPVPRAVQTGRTDEP
jgi:hypothetical protein